MKKKKYLLIFNNTFLLFALTVLLANCGTSKESMSISDEEKKAFAEVEGDTISISSDKTEYEILIIEPGFYTWLNSIAKPEGYYSQKFLENRNYLMVLDWNRRVLQPMQFNPNLYELQIDYTQNIDYGYEVNYKLYNYFIYFQRKYDQRLGPFLPRI
jgi:signal peptidase I